MAGKEPPHRVQDERETASSMPPPGVMDVRDPLPDDVRDPSFSTAVRGYDRHAVDRYVERVNRLIAELQVSGSPKAAVRHALDRVGEQTSGILQHARETAEEITASARQEAEETTARAKAEAHDITTDAGRQASDATARAKADADQLLAAARTEADTLLAHANDQSETTLAQARAEAEARAGQVEEQIASLREDAETRMRALQADIAAISDERRALLDELRGIAARVEAFVAEAGPTEAETLPESPEPPAAVTTDAIPPSGSNGTEAHDQPPQTTKPDPEN